MINLNQVHIIKSIDMDIFIDGINDIFLIACVSCVTELRVNELNLNYIYKITGVNKIWIGSSSITN